MDKWDFGVRCYYGIRAKPPKVPGALAIETVHVGKHSMDMEISAGRRRRDIGRVDARDLRKNGPWETVYTEANSQSMNSGRN